MARHIEHYHVGGLYADKNGTFTVLERWLTSEKQVQLRIRYHATEDSPEEDKVVYLGALMSGRIKREGLLVWSAVQYGNGPFMVQDLLPDAERNRIADALAGINFSFDRKQITNLRRTWKRLMQSHGHLIEGQTKSVDLRNFVAFVEWYAHAYDLAEQRHVCRNGLEVLEKQALSPRLFVPEDAHVVNPADNPNSLQLLTRHEYSFATGKASRNAELTLVDFRFGGTGWKPEISRQGVRYTERFTKNGRSLKGMDLKTPAMSMDYYTCDYADRHPEDWRWRTMLWPHVESDLLVDCGEDFVTPEMQKRWLGKPKPTTDDFRGDVLATATAQDEWRMVNA
ncbi:hypothetical protein ACPV5S_15780 [Vibrio astriarenae]